jgi:ribosomal protein S18 acetylase RimI-like enzyme
VENVTISKVARSENVVPTLVMAFSADPIVRWMLPEPTQFLEHFSELARLHAERTTALGGAFARSDRRGAALWYPPGTHPDSEAIGRVFDAAGIGERIADLFAAIAPYEPSEPHWYLRQIGVDPALQGGGHGSALLAAALAEVDERGDVAYLEATTARGAALYERHGFRVLAEVQVGDAPPLWPMRREPR